MNTLHTDLLFISMTIKTVRWSCSWQWQQAKQKIENEGQIRQVELGSCGTDKPKFRARGPVVATKESETERNDPTYWQDQKE